MTESKSGSCDFCGFYQAEYTINGGLWWICKPCMQTMYGGCTCTEDLVMIHHSPCKFAGQAVGEEE